MSPCFCSQPKPKSEAAEGSGSGGFGAWYAWLPIEMAADCHRNDWERHNSVFCVQVRGSARSSTRYHEVAHVRYHLCWRVGNCTIASVFDCSSYLARRAVMLSHKWSSKARALSVLISSEHFVLQVRLPCMSCCDGLAIHLSLTAVPFKIPCADATA